MRLRAWSIAIAIAIVFVTLAGALAVGAYFVGHLHGMFAPREFVRGYTIQDPEPIKAAGR